MRNVYTFRVVLDADSIIMQILAAHKTVAGRLTAIIRDMEGYQTNHNAPRNALFVSRHGVGGCLYPAQQMLAGG